ncbi:hypothetical protein WBG83_06320 [Paenibacillus sp. y28]
MVELQVTIDRDDLETLKDGALGWACIGPVLQQIRCGWTIISAAIPNRL